MRSHPLLLLFALGVSANVSSKREIFRPPSTTPDDIHVEDQFELSIETPDLKARKSSKLILGNGLKAYIISDPGIVKAGAALSVETGSWRDPPGVSGLGIQTP